MAQLKDNLELVIAVVGALSAIGGVLVAALLYAWKGARWAAKFLDRDKEIEKRDKALAERLAVAGRRFAQLADQLQKLRIETAGMTVKLDEREKDQARLEGKIEQNTAAMMKLAGDLREMANSTSRIWTVLRTIRPDVVPKRAGDPG